MAKDRQKVIQAAEKLAARGRIQAAIDEYRKVLDRHPNDTTTLNRVGDLYVRLNRLPKAIDLFEKTAESFSRQGFFVKAIAIYKKMIRLDPGQIGAYEALADLYHRQGLTGDSLAQYQVVSDYYVKHGAVDSALHVQQSMVEIEPENPTRRLQLAEMLKREQRTAEAQDQYQAIADLMLEHSRGDDAFKVLVGALDIDAGNLDYVRRALHALQNAGFDRLAEDLLDDAIRRNPQANALRLDELETPAAKAETVAEDEVTEAAETESAASDDEPAIEITTQATPIGEDAGAEAVEEEAAEEEVIPEEVAAETTDDDLSSIDLSELEELPAEGLDPVVEVQEAAPTAAAEASEATAPDGESSFELDDAEIEAPVAESDSEQAGVPQEKLAESAVAESTETEPAAETEEEFTFELDIDEVSAQLAEVSDEPAEVIPAAAPTPAADEPQPAATEAPSSRGEGEWTKLLIEADVLARYEMHDMATGVIERVLQAAPEHAGAQCRLALSHLAGERLAEALELAGGLAERLEDEGAPDRWLDLCDALSSRGYTLEGERFVGDPSAVSAAAAAAEEAEAAVAAEEVEETAETAEAAVEEAPQEAVPALEQQVEAEQQAEPEPAIEEKVADEFAVAADSMADEALARVVDDVLTEVGAEARVEEQAAPEEVTEQAPPEISEEAPEEIPEEAAEAPLSLEQIVAETAEFTRPRRKAPADSAEGVLADVIEEIERADEPDRSVEQEAPSAEPEPVAESEAPAQTTVEAPADEATEPPVESPAEEAAEPTEEVAATPAAAAPEAEVEPVEEVAGDAVDADDADGEVSGDDVEWIRELERAEAAASSTAPLEPGTGEFVDLATELEAELSDDAGFEDELLPTMGEQSLEDIVEGFRQGMAETLADEDYDTHYNLGIAYREMELVDEAIGEFQLAAKDPRYLVECCSLLASCFVDKNFNDLAVQWYARGLESAAIDDESRCGLLYELGTLLAAMGEPDAARERFLELYGINSNYRDVVAKLEELPS